MDMWTFSMHLNSNCSVHFSCKMCNFKIILWGCLVFVQLIKLVAPCKNPLGDKGTCKNIWQCESTKGIFQKRNRNAAEIQFLKDSNCGYDGYVPKICCSKNVPILTNECLTPNGEKGKCIRIYNCTTVLDVLSGGRTEDHAFVEKSRCPGPGDAYFVCCPPSPPTHPETTHLRPVSVTSSTISSTTTPQDPPPFDEPDKCPSTELPPDPESGCCGVQYEYSDRIYGGSDTGMYKYPWLALIEYRRGNTVEVKCGGSLISGRYVLTAAHCVDSPVYNKWTIESVRLGDYDISNQGADCQEVEGGDNDCTNPITVRVAMVYKHVNYSTTALQANDIALIRLEKMVQFTSFIAPICLPTVNVMLSHVPDLNFMVAGWGATGDENSHSTVKQHVQIPYVNRTICMAWHEVFKHLGSNQLCAGGEPGKDSCKGDSGGPLMYLRGKRYELTGIVSFGLFRCGQNRPAVYTNVIGYKYWIGNIIRAVKGG